MPKFLFSTSIKKRISFYFFVFLLSISILLLALKINLRHDSYDDCISPTTDEVWIPGATFTMGENEAYRNERPEHVVTIKGFWIDIHEVTNSQFSNFVEETGYITVAERIPDRSILNGAPKEMFKPGSVVFIPPNDKQNVKSWWKYIPGAYWRAPFGPGSDINGKENYPVVHIAYEDAYKYAEWAGRSLPTEAQFELASRSNLEKETFAWGGEELAPNGKHLANTWQGVFPIYDSGEDGHKGIAPVGCFKPNFYGAYDLIGNVWEWTDDMYFSPHKNAKLDNTLGSSKIDSKDLNDDRFPTRVIKGGSFMCSPDFCMRYRPSARHAQDTGIGSNHIGFRTVSNRDNN